MKFGLTALVLTSAGLCPSGVEAKPYKGAEVYTQTPYKFGRIEVRMRSARGDGILSTFFTYKPGSEAAGALWEEIDIEILGKSNAAAFQSNILVGNPRMGSEQMHQGPASLADAYHTYTIEWTPTTVVWQLDGVETRKTTGGQAEQLTNAHNFRFNIWASDVSSWAGAFASSSLPQYQFVNWIRYYRYEGGAFVLDWSDDFNTFDTTRWSKADWTFDGNLVDFDPNNAVARDGALVLCMTAEGQGCTGAVPADPSGGIGGVGGSGGAGNGGASGMAGGGAGGAGGTPSGGASASAGSSGAPSGGGATSGGAVNAGSSATGGASSPAGGVAGALATAGATSVTGGAGGPGLGGSAVSNPGGTQGGNAVATPTAAETSGCGCAVAGAERKGWLWLAVGLGLGLRVRRKRDRHRETPRSWPRR